MEGHKTNLWFIFIYIQIREEPRDAHPLNNGLPFLGWLLPFFCA